MIQIGRRRYEVVDTTASYGVIESRAGLELGARGVARVDLDRTDGAVEPLATPTPLSEFEDTWPDPVHPADAQDPDPIPLGLVAEDRRLIVRLQASGGALIPLGERGTTVGRGVLRARVHAEPFAGLPFAVDADAAVQMYFARNVSNRRGARSQSLLRFRQLQLSYGTDESFYGAIGRLRYAAQSVGMLDGLRVRTESFGPFSFGAFGGFVPDARDGRPAFDAARFGVEASARDLSAALRPMASVVALGSVFDGSMDERRLLVQAQLLPGRSRVGGHFEVQLFDEDNPFGASTVEVTAAGVDGAIRFDPVKVGARLDYRRPDRSRWLFSQLPVGFFCDPDGVTCGAAYAARIQGVADAEVEFGDVAVAAGATAIATPSFGENVTSDGIDRVGGFLRARAVRLFEMLRLEAMVAASVGDVIDVYSARLAAAMALAQGAVDIGVHYRPAIYLDEASQQSLIEHGIGLRAVWSPLPGLDVAARGELVTGALSEALLVSMDMAWRIR